MGTDQRRLRRDNPRWRCPSCPSTVADFSEGAWESAVSWTDRSGLVSLGGMHRVFRALLLVLSAVLWLWAARAGAAASFSGSRPNILYILCDDLGYGDVRALNSKSRIATPNLDRLAAGGMTFTDAHSSSSVCTPTRYGLLTGRYNWRSRLKRGVLGGLSPRLIEDGRLTVAEFLRTNGYVTACIGKWHLGMDWARTGAVAELEIETRPQVFHVDYAQPIRNGPLSLGFDHYFGISASLDMVPYTFIRDDRVTIVPTEDRKIEMMFGRTNGFTRQGPAAPGFTGYEVLPTLAAEALSFIRNQAARAKQGHPFFLYLPLTSPHTPVLPNERWRGRSGLNPYADFVQETDHEVGRVLDELERQGLANETLVVFASDNGCSPSAEFDRLVAMGHQPSGGFRGHKADIFEGGHRVPFLVRWPGRVPAGVRSAQLICLTDLMATAAELLGVPLPPNAGEDSVSFLPVMLGRGQGARREAVVHHSIDGSFAIRQGNWKLALTSSSGGWSAPRPGTPAAAKLPAAQLYDLSADPGETNNLQARHPEIVDRLTKLLEKYVADGRSTPGPVQSNTWPVEILASGNSALSANRDGLRIPEGIRRMIPSRNDDTGFTELFGANAADGWAQCGPGSFSLTNGVATSHGGMGLWWYTRRPFTNFILRGEWRFEQRESDSGVFVRFPDPGQDPWSATRLGHELELGDDPSGLQITWRTGSLYPFQPPARVPTRPIGEWNDFEFVVVDQLYIVRINGETVTEWTDPNGRSSSGYIGLQNYAEGKGTQHRRLRIRELR